MKTSRRHPVSVNTGSMADIAFLLLIFFLLSTTISADKGILRQLPAFCENGDDCTSDLKERNVLIISINLNDEILISDTPIELSEVSTAVKEFVDNNGLSQCHYCSGKQLPEWSEHPAKAVISMQFHKQTSYEQFIAVQNAIASAYNELRNELALSEYNINISQVNTSQIEILKQRYPIKVSEVTLD